MRTAALAFSLFALAGSAQAQMLSFTTPFTPGTPGTPAGARQLETSYSGSWSAASPRYNRVIEGSGGELAPNAPAALSAAATNVVYSVQSFVPSTTTLYEFFSAQSIDGYLSLYEGAFNPLAPLTNVRAADDDMSTLNSGVVPNRGGVTSTNDSGFRFNLTAGTTYNIVTAAFGNATNSGNFFNEIYRAGTPAIPGTPPSPLISIPDNNTGGVTLDLVVPNTQMGAIVSFESLRLISINHTWVGDLRMSLTHVESGLSVTFLDRPGRVLPTDTGFSSDLAGNYTFVDGGAAITGANSVLTPGTYGTANPLAAFIGTPAAGTWRLNIADVAATDVGSFSAFGLDFTVPTPGTAGLLALGALVASRRRR